MYFCKKIVKKTNMSYFNTILGGFFGLFRGIILSFLFLSLWDYFSTASYSFYIKNSNLIYVFLYLKSYVYLFLQYLKN